MTGLLFVLAVQTIIGQLKQPNRYELSLNGVEAPFKISTVEKNKLLLFRDKGHFTPEGKAWEFVKLDSALNVEWERIFYINPHLVYGRFASHGNKVYFLFVSRGNNSVNIELIEVNSITGVATQRTVKNVIPFRLTHFTASQNGVFIGGTYNYRPLVLYYQFDSKKSRILPGFYHEKGKLLQLKVQFSHPVILTRNYLSNYSDFPWKLYGLVPRFLHLFLLSVCCGHLKSKPGGV